MGETVIDTAIVGSGPYGLGLAAHLSQAGVPYRIFGRPMEAWSTMSPGMFLKSFAHATNIAVPGPNLTLPEYCRARNLEDYEPVPIAAFARYGKWVQEQLVPNVEPVNVRNVEHDGSTFTVTLETSEQVRARRVVLAVGLSYFAHMPDILSGLPTELASHTAVHGDFSRFRGMDVTVVGAGQSALQAGALLHENGATARLLARGEVVWHGRTPKGARRTLRERVLAPNSMVGPGRENWVMQHAPMLLHYLPADRRASFTRSQLGPAGAWWLRDRVQGKLPTLSGVSVVAARCEKGGLRLRTVDQDRVEREFHTDHVIAGTGYRVDVGRMAFLNDELVRKIKTTDGAPVLSRNFESSVDGLYFVGPASAASFGPLFRFVVGSYYTVPRLARHLTGSASRRAHPWRAPLPKVRGT